MKITEITVKQVISEIASRSLFLHCIQDKL